MKKKATPQVKIAHLQTHTQRMGLGGKVNSLAVMGLVPRQGQGHSGGGGGQGQAPQLTRKDFVQIEKNKTL